MIGFLMCNLISKLSQHIQGQPESRQLTTEVPVEKMSQCQTFITQSGILERRDPLNKGENQLQGNKSTSQKHLDKTSQR